MKAEQILSNVWGVWLSFSSGNKQQAHYGTNLIRLHQIKSWADFAYIWTQSNIKDPNYFFANPQTGQYHKFQIQGSMRKIQSINFFKHPIEPTWQYGDNSNGGYFNFSLLRDVSPEQVKKIFEILTFMAIGESLELCENLKGIRIVDTSAKKKFRCRFEIWLNYPETDENLQKIKNHALMLKQMLEKNQVILNDIKFYNIGGKPELGQKGKKPEQNDKK